MATETARSATFAFGRAKARLLELEALNAAINKAQAVIEFNLDGTVIDANDNFLSALGYTLDEIRGRHHSLFVEPAYRESEDYRRFWEQLRAGQYDARQYKRIGKAGREVWIQASYNPLFDAHGKPYKVVKFATDITPQVKASRALDEAVVETQQVVQAVVAGANDKRIAMAGKTGQLEVLSRAVNDLIDNVLTAVGETQRVVQGAIEGDLTQRITIDGKTGHFLTLSRAVNALIENMMGVVRELQRTSRDVQSRSEEIARGNLNLSQRTEEQSSGLEETASSMVQMTSTVKRNAENAARANELAVAARGQAEKGGTVVTEAVCAMQAINTASRKIADIIGVIDEIAFQTNLLALNAAVEAARAGEQGRGFAVVATEVRTLASRSAEAAKEIKLLISDSVAKVAEGTKLVDQSGQVLTEIVGSVKKVTDVVGEIASASAEQSAGIEQVNKAVMCMDETTQQNAALVEEAAAATQSLMEQAGTLGEMMSRFQVGATTAADAAPAPAKRTAAPAARTPASTAGAPALERRGPNRPWSGKAKAGREPAAERKAPAATSRKVASGGASGEDWTEF